MNTTDNTIIVVRNFCQSLAQRNLAGILDLFAEEVDWDIPGNKQVAFWLGKRSKKEEIAAFFELLWKNTEFVTARIDHILTDKNFGVVIGEFTTRMLQTNKIVESIFSIHITVQNDLIVRYRVQEDSYGVMVALNG